MNGQNSGLPEDFRPVTGCVPDWIDIKSICADAFKSPSRGQKLQAEYKTLSDKLEALEAEYYARED